MARLTFRCPSCQVTQSAVLSDADLCCSACSVKVCTPGPQFAAESSGQQAVDRCLVCGSPELFVRKDFPQRLGVTIVAVGFAASCITWNYHWVVATFAILFGTAFIDVALYFLMGNVLECYQCHSQYRGLPELDGHEAFDLEVHERHRQQAARMKAAANDTPM
ncbi:MAG: hypothetical protein KDB27_26450 [Planctomycetales bacterium]|nr:hypothetical protein [Planctomycetales bacterium]